MIESLPTLLTSLEEERRAEEERYRDLCLVIRGYGRAETLLCAGGRWDAARKCWASQEPEKAHVVEVGPGQEPFIRWAARFVEDYRDGHEVAGYVRAIRDRVLLAEGGRRGGKTQALQMAQWALAVDVPMVRGKPLVCWAIHVSHREEEEYFDNLRGEFKIVPPHWYKWRARLQRFDLAHGSYVQMISSDDPRTTRRGKVDIAFINEAQKQRQATLVNLLYGVADRGGLAILAANPNDTLSGEWVHKFKEGIAEGTLPHAVSFYFDPKLNPFIDQKARSDVDDIVALIDPQAHKRDSLGEWLPIGDRAYFRFRKKIHILPPPDLGLRDITAEYLRRRTGRAYDYVAGVDFQGTPHHAAVVCKVFGTMADPILWVVGEYVAEQATEDDLLDMFDEDGHSPESLLFVGDCSGAWQDGRHSKNGRDSFGVFKSRRWHIVPPTKPKDPKRHAKNPPVEKRMALMNKLLGRDKPEGEERPVVEPRLYVGPACTKLAEALKECPVVAAKYGKKPMGFYSHITDALGYAAWWVFPRPDKPVTTGSLGESVDIRRPTAW